MRLEVETKALRRTLERVSGVPDKERPTVMGVPTTYHCVLLDAEGSELRICAFDGEHEMQSAPVEIKAEAGGQIAVNARRLMALVKSVEVDVIKMELGEQAFLRIQAGSSKYALAGQSAKSWPSELRFSEGHDLKVDAARLQSLLHAVVYSASTDPSRYNLSGVYIEPGEKGINAVSTDGHRLAMAHLACKMPKQLPPPAILSAKTAKQVIRMASGVEDAKATLRISDNGCTVTLEGERFRGRLVDGRFPDYRQVIPKSRAFAAVVDKGALDRSLQRVELFVTGQNHGRLTLSLLPASAEVEIGLASEEGRVEERLPATFQEGESDFMVGLNIKYVRDALGHIAGDRVLIEASDELAPVVILDADDQANEGRRAIIMPMRL